MRTLLKITVKLTFELRVRKKFFWSLYEIVETTYHPKDYCNQVDFHIEGEERIVGTYYNKNKALIKLEKCKL